ncbi:hypothetical protein DICPUDRAFT_149793, partial [Dictyostelium purpureum]
VLYLEQPSNIKLLISTIHDNLLTMVNDLQSPQTEILESLQEEKEISFIIEPSDMVSDADSFKKIDQKQIEFNAKTDLIDNQEPEILTEPQIKELITGINNVELSLQEFNTKLKIILKKCENGKEYIKYID